MSREFPIGLTPPDWLVRNLQPQRAAPVNRPAVARAALAMTLPLAIGLAVGQPSYGALASMGALSGVIGDTADAYRMRILNIAIPQLFGAVGVTLGSAVYGLGWPAVATVTGVALVSGMISTIGAVASVSGLLLLLNCVVGAGLPMPGPWWLAPLLMTGGGLLVLLLALLAWPLRSMESLAWASNSRSSRRSSVESSRTSRRSSSTVRDGTTTPSVPRRLVSAWLVLDPRAPRRHAAPGPRSWARSHWSPWMAR